MKTPSTPVDVALAERFAERLAAGQPKKPMQLSRVVGTAAKVPYRN